MDRKQQVICMQANVFVNRFYGIIQQKKVKLGRMVYYIASGPGFSENIIHT